MSEQQAGARTILKGGKVIDPAAGHEGQLDVAVANGQVESVGADLPTEGAQAGGAMLAGDDAMLAGAPPQMWKHLNLRLEEIVPFYSGGEISLIANFAGEMESFAGEKAPVAYTLVANGARR